MLLTHSPLIHPGHGLSLELRCIPLVGTRHFGPADLPNNGDARSRETCVD